MKKTYKEMFPGPTGMFTVDQLKNMPFGGYGVLEQQELNKRFITVDVAADEMSCCPGTARHRMADIVQFSMGVTGRFYYEKKAAMEIIKKYKEKKKNAKLKRAT